MEIAFHATAGASRRCTRVDMNRLSKGEQLMLGCSGVLLITSFLDLWSKYEFSGGGIVQGTTARGNAWNSYSFAGKLMVLAVLATVVVLGIKAFQESFELPAMAHVGLGGATFAFLLLMLVMGPEDGGLGGVATELAGLEISRGLFLFVGLLLGAGVLGGALMHKGVAPTPSGGAAPPPAV
jgi:hypothetical protein